MADATTAARDRIDRALAGLERRITELKARAAVPASPDDDLFATVDPDPSSRKRIAELEAAGREASQALARAADQVRGLLADPTGSENG